LRRGETHTGPAAETRRAGNSSRWGELGVKFQASNAIFQQLAAFARERLIFHPDKVSERRLRRSFEQNGRQK
jgi:hypothetical protein